MFGLLRPLRHLQKCAVEDLGHARREWRPANLFLPRKGVLDHNTHYDSNYTRLTSELRRESNEIKCLDLDDFKTLDSILLGEDECDRLSDSNTLNRTVRTWKKAVFSRRERPSFLAFHMSRIRTRESSSVSKRGFAAGSGSP
jgi:hypothetical protein